MKYDCPRDILPIGPESCIWPCFVRVGQCSGDSNVIIIHPPPPQGTSGMGQGKGIPNDGPTSAGGGIVGQNAVPMGARAKVKANPKSPADAGCRYVCEECGDRRKSQYSLNAHMRKHGPVTCHVCEQEFCSRSSFKIHLKNEHPRGYQCLLCKRIELDANSVIKHILDHKLLAQEHLSVYRFLKEVDHVSHVGSV